MKYTNELRGPEEQFAAMLFEADLSNETPELPHDISADILDTIEEDLNTGDIKHLIKDTNDLVRWIDSMIGYAERR